MPKKKKNRDDDASSEAGSVSLATSSSAIEMEKKTKKKKKKPAHNRTLSKAALKSPMNVLSKSSDIVLAGDWKVHNDQVMAPEGKVVDLDDVQQQIYESDIKRFKELYEQLQNMVATSKSLSAKKEKKFKRVVKMLEKRLEQAGDIVRKDYKTMKSHQKETALANVVGGGSGTVTHDGADEKEEHTLRVVSFLLNNFGEGEKNLERLETMYEKEPEGCFKYGHLMEEPHLQQYYKDNGKTIVRGDEEHKVMWVELFFDLIFVVALAHLGIDLEHGRNGKAVATFCTVFIAIWQIWAACTKYANRLAPRDVFHKLFYMTEMVAVLGMVAHTVTGVVGSYILGRTVVEIFTWYAAAFNPELRATAMMQSFILFLSLAPWVYSLSLDKSSNTDVAPDADHLAFWAAGLAIEALGQALVLSSPKFSIPFNVEHLAERFGLFTIIMLGEAIVALLFDAGQAINSTYFDVVLSGLLAWNFQSLYFDVEAGRHKQHALLGNKIRGWVWYTTHILLHAAIVATAAGTKLIIHSTLTGIVHYEDNTFERWLFCGATSTSYFCFSVLGLTHKAHHDVIIKKKYRVAIRLVLSTLMGLMPLIAGDKISLTAYIGVVASLSTLTTIIELYGGIAPEFERRTTKKRQERQEQALAEAYNANEGDTIRSKKLLS